MNKKILTAVLCLLSLSVVSIASAQTTQQKVEKAVKKEIDTLNRKAKQFGQSATTCAKEFPVFLASFFSPENPFSDFYDIFRNQCQIDDIDNVQQRIDGLRNQLKAAYLKCNQEEITPLKEQFAEATYELYFIRNMVDTKNGQYIVKDLDVLVKDSLSFFSEGSPVLIPTQKMNQLAYSMSAKYTKRIQDYKKCNSFDEWKRVAKRWKSFEEGMKSAGEDLGKTVTDTSYLKDPPQSEHLKLNRGPLHAVGSYLGSHMKLNVGVPPRVDINPGFTDLIYTKKAVVNPGQSSDSHQDQINKIEARQLKIDIDKEVQTLEARYSILYGDASDNAVQDILKKVDELNGVIETTYKEVLPKVGQCAKVPNKKQCTNVK